ncbi:sigma-70 family RNA polymerase sigma factor [Micromonospora globbae]|uniref:sigma-70 family RNA polymerase sigma factor n=1 Tax=Micromonospora globbae TaxID=1894969 RepID=UPI0034176912
MDLVEHFEASRPRLLSLAHRIVGSHHDAEDAVQTAWLRAQSADPAQVTNPDGWFTAVTARLCLDLLRARRRRGEVPLTADDVPGEQIAVDEAFLRREEVSRALLVVLGELSPRQRVAYVLHDLFAVPFDQVAAVLDTTAASAKKLASRARLRLEGAGPADPGRLGKETDVVDAFLAAARGGDIARLVTLMAPDVVRTADRRLLPAGARAVVRGARAVAEETRAFVDRIASAVPVVVEGRPGALIAPGGHPYALIRIRVRDGLVTGIGVAPYEPGVVSLPAAG